MPRREETGAAFRWMRPAEVAALPKLRRNLQDHGYRETLRKCLVELLGPLYLHVVYRIYVIDLRLDLQVPEKSGCFTFRVLQPGDRHLISQVEQHADWLRGRLEEKIRQGSMCLVAVSSPGNLAGYNLISFGNVWIPLIETERHFREGLAWSEQIAVNKNFRRRGLASEIRYSVFEKLRQRQVKKLYGGTLSNNFPSLKLARKLGFKEVADVHYYRILNDPRWHLMRVIV